MKNIEPRIVTYKEIIDIMDRKKENEKKYRIKVSYGKGDEEYRFNINKAMQDSLKY